MRFGILGPLEVWENGHELQLGAGRQRALLAMLLMHANEVVTTDRLVDALWDEHPPATAAKAVQGYVSQLRKTIPEHVLITRRPGYLLRAAETDAREFERLVEESEAQAPAEAARTLRRALELWRGRPFEDVQYEPWAQVEIARLEELRLTAVAERIEAELQLGRDVALVPELESLVVEHPLHERLRSQLMLALYRSGRQAEALDVFATGRRRLVDELGLEPGPELQDLHRRILRHDPELGSVRSARPVLSRPRFLRLAVVMTVLFAAAAVAGLAYWLTRGAARTVVVARNSLAAIDPKTDRLVADVRVGDGPGKVVAAGDHVWTLNAASRTVSEIDVTQRDAPRTFAIGGSPGDLAVGDGALWTTETTTHRLEKIDPTSGATIGSVPAIGRVRSGRTGTPYPSTRDGGEVAVGSSGVWFGSDHATVTRVDPRTLHPETTVRNLNVGPGGQLVVVPGAVWVDDSFGNVTQIDPLTTDVVGEAHLATGDVGGIAVDAKAVWATATDEGLVWEIAPQTDAPVDSFRVAPDPVGVALGASSVWVASAGGTVTRLDPATGGTTTIAVGGSPQGVAFADGLVWVSVD